MSEKLTIGQRIRQRRKELGLTQQELANKSGYKSKTAIAKIEADERKILSSKLNAFANALNVDVNFLLDDDNHVNQNQVILIEKDGTKLTYVLTDMQTLKIKEMINMFIIESFNGKVDDSKPSLADIIFGTKDAPYEVKMNKLYNLLIMIDWENETITPQLDALLNHFCEVTHTTREQIFEDAKQLKKEKLKQGLPYPF